MIKLFITDIDGCLTSPFKKPSWELLSQIRRLNEQSEVDLAIPSLSICSGRPLPYVEAVAQWLGVNHPVVFESGGIYELATNNVELSTAFDEEAERQVEQLKDWLQQNIINKYPDMILEFTKRMDAGLIHLEKGTIDDVFPLISEYVDQNYPRFEVHRTEVSINVIPTENNKESGIKKLCEMIGIEPDEAAYIGDSSGDIPGLKIVGHPFAPLNASADVKKHAQVLKAEVTEAVLMAYRKIIEANRKEIAVNQ
ncbi:MAG TPA: HAD-IIB family hydrolase [Balneolaceae bacterium]|nr:HAD-IIB family hydrolase [Balneolaceae bacterium]